MRTALAIALRLTELNAFLRSKEISERMLEHIAAPERQSVGQRLKRAQKDAAARVRECNSSEALEALLHAWGFDQVDGRCTSRF